MNVASGEVAQHLAPTQGTKRSPIGIGMVRVVGDEDDRHPALPRLRHVAQHHAGLLHAERRRGLVQDQDPGAEVDGTGDGDGLPLAARQCADRLRRIAELDSEAAQLLAHDALAVRAIDPPERPAPTQGSAPRKKLRHTLSSGIIARSW